MAPNNSRRYACDRCRAHKLRCNRDLMASTDSGCLRCRKAKAVCSIGSSVGAGSAVDMGHCYPNELDAVNFTHTGDSGNVLRAHQNQNSTGLDQIRKNPAAEDSNSSDDSHLISIRWPNQSQPSLLETQENFEESMVVDDMLLPHIPPNFEDVGSSYRHDSIFNDFDALPETHFDSHTAYDTGVEQTQGFEHNIPRSQQDPSPASSDPNALLHNNNSETSPTKLTTAGSGDGESLSLIGLKDACFQQLSDLSAILTKNFHRVEVLERACSYLFDSSSKTAVEYLHVTLESSVIEDDSIGNMLRGSEQFL
ncbi:hypothetical protein AJ78_03679 [Emergomyces pasteurianus Ep9510]|uniref:Zn(2)-C6 fungal-type domain-containing protein n=1 Tax=Emergomyces pasteurianus Ep9510 TaxID=1447872 RepID=A0A1J9Q777_9EURO|nr:hypothetical protein AJ78_03679 [Emergomyces pasteurianus Ep9510]